MLYTLLQGAYILDSIMNYNDSSGSQSTPKAYSERLNPNFMKNVEKNDRRGDFISLISRSLDDQDMITSC